MTLVKSRDFILNHEYYLEFDWDMPHRINPGGSPSVRFIGKYLGEINTNTDVLIEGPYHGRFYAFWISPVNRNINKALYLDALNATVVHRNKDQDFNIDQLVLIPQNYINEVNLYDGNYEPIGSYPEDDPHEDPRNLGKKIIVRAYESSPELKEKWENQVTKGVTQKLGPDVARIIMEHVGKPLQGLKGGRRRRTRRGCGGAAAAAKKTRISRRGGRK